VAARSRSKADDDARPAVGPTAPVKTWFEEEPPLGAAARAQAARLYRRAAASWPLWVAGAFLLAGAAATMVARAPTRYEVTAIVNVTEGTLSAQRPAIATGSLRTYLSSMAFTSANLLDVAKKHPRSYPDLSKDPQLVVAAILGQMNVGISNDEFVEDRALSDPPRAARLTLEVTASSPEMAFALTQELTSLVMTSALATQRERLEGIVASGTAALARAETQIADLQAAGTSNSDPRLEAARDRWAATDRDLASARLALHAAEEHQGLQFEIVDPGHVPPRQSKTEKLVHRFLTVLLVALAFGSLMVGAFDPRVLDESDLSSLGLPVLGAVPELPRAAPRPEGGRQRARV